MYSSGFLGSAMHDLHVKSIFRIYVFCSFAPEFQHSTVLPQFCTYFYFLRSSDCLELRCMQVALLKPHVNKRTTMILGSSYSRCMLICVCTWATAQLQQKKGQVVMKGKMSKQSEIERLHWTQAHYEELKADRDTAEHQADETARQLSKTEKQLKECQDALSNSAHEVNPSTPLLPRLPPPLPPNITPLAPTPCPPPPPPS